MKPKVPSVPISRLREIWSYDPGTGIFRWRIHVSRKCRAGTIAGLRSGSHQYIRLSYDGHVLYAHRVAWAVSFGEWPPADIDHIDMNKRNNRLANLRLASRAQNIIHRPVRRNSLTGVKGVYHDKRDGRFYPYIDIGGKRLPLGGFGSLIEADKARVDAEALYHREFCAQRA